jgi:hypothetical protein
MKPLSSLLLGLCGPLVAVSSVASSLVDNFSSLTNDRFANDSSFILQGYDLSGVAVNDSGIYGTLLSANVFISANHYHPAPGNRMTFYETNDPGGSRLTRTVSGGQRIDNDIWVGTLDQALPAQYQTYSLASETLSTTADFQASTYAGTVGYLLGRSQTSDSQYGGGAATDQVVGENVLDLWFDDVDVGGVIDDAMGAIRNVPSDTDYRTHETYLQGGDSGGPMFALSGGQLQLVGINWFIGTFEPSGPQFSGFSYVGNYHGQLQSYIQANAVPEPGTLLLMAGALVSLGLLRRR